MNSSNMLNMNNRWRTLTICVITAFMVSACDGGSSPEPTGPGPNGSYLFIDSPSYYFGTADVGTKRTQTVEVVNQGADIYPIKSLKILGENREEFVSDFYGSITLNPSEAVQLNLTFQPVSNGRKFADIEIDLKNTATT